LIYVTMKNDQLCHFGPLLYSLTVQTFSFWFLTFFFIYTALLPSAALLCLFFVSNIQYRESRKKRKEKQNKAKIVLIESRPQLCFSWLNTGLCHPQSRALADQNYTDCHLLPRWQIGDRQWGSGGMSNLVELWELKFTLNT